MRFIFSLGILNKKLLLTVLFSLNDVISNLFDYIFINNNINTYQIADSIGLGLGGISTILIPCIFKYKKTDGEKICSKQNFKFISILVVFNLIYYGIAIISFLTDESNNTNDPNVESLFSREALELILLTIITFILLKYRYYIHHIISLIIFCLLSIFIDLLLNNYKKGLLKIKFYTIILNILFIISEMVYFCYLTYLMRIKFYNYWTLNFISGTIILAFNSFSLIIALAFGDPNGEPNYLNSIFYFFKEVNTGYIILRFLLQFVFKGINMQLIRILILDNLSPNHILISFEISKIVNILTNSRLDNKWITLIPIFSNY